MIDPKAVVSQDSQLNSDGSEGIDPNATVKKPISEKKVAANRANGRKSRGPRSPAGKAVSSRNATRHGLLAATPVLQGLESQEIWERHQRGFFRALAPVGYCEKFHVMQIAYISWQLGRVGRFETQVVADNITATEQDLEDVEYGCSKPRPPALLVARLQITSAVINLFEALPKLSHEKKVDKLTADAVLCLLWLQLPAKKVPVAVPGVPNDENELAAFDGWTAGLLRTAVEHYAVAGGMNASELVDRCLEAAAKGQHQAQEEEDKFVKSRNQFRLEREKCRRMLLKPELLDRVNRYKSPLERSFFKWLDGLKALQALRLKRAVMHSANPDAEVD